MFQSRHVRSMLCQQSVRLIHDVIAVAEQSSVGIRLDLLNPVLERNVCRLLAELQNVLHGTHIMYSELANVRASSNTIAWRFVRIDFYGPNLFPVHTR